jgi:pimeloyl-ACP methyl ester carboxylesterase
MTMTALIEHTVTVAGKPIFFAEAGNGPSVVMLHGGGPGASGVSNYSRNIDALAEHFRVIVPDMPGYGRSGKGVNQSDPFGYLAGMIRGLLDEHGLATTHVVGNSYGGAAALRLALDTPKRVDKLVLMGALAVGQHTNDRELSYYAMTPSGFEWEVGWNPIVIDEKTWEPTTYQGISLWGHTREGQTIVEKLAHFKTAAHSLLRREDTVPALACAAIPDD